MSYLSRLGFGVLNKVAFVTDPDDGVRSERVLESERIAAVMGVHVRGFHYMDAEALDWLSDPTKGP